MQYRLKLLLIAIVSTFFSFFLGEMALRFTGFKFALHPTEVQFGWPKPVILKELYDVDSNLLWVPKDYLSKVSRWKEKRPSVVFMGDSTTEFGRYDDFLKSLIDKENPNNAFTFVNVGVSGWSSYQGLQQLKRDVLPMKPHFITIYYGWNDHWKSFGIEDKAIGKYILASYSNIRIVQLVNNAIFSFKRRNDEKKQRRSNPRRVPLADYRYNLLEMVRIAKKNDITPILITAPSSHVRGNEPAYLKRRFLKNLHELVPLHREYVQVVRDVSAAEGVHLVDLYAKFYQYPRKDIEEYFFRDGIHLKEKGNQKMAALIYEYLVKNNLNAQLMEN